MKLFYLLITFVVITTSLLGQDLTKTEIPDAIKKLSFLVGNWQGSGWVQSNQETDSLKINQITTIIDSETTFQMDISSELSPTKSFKTIILVSYDKRDKNFLTSATSFGRTSNGEATIINDHTLQCRYALNNGTEFKYTYSVPNSSEIIVGEVTSDNGASWTQIFGGTLSK